MNALSEISKVHTQSLIIKSMVGSKLLVSYLALSSWLSIRLSRIRGGVRVKKRGVCAAF